MGRSKVSPETTFWTSEIWSASAFGQSSQQDWQGRLSEGWTHLSDVEQSSSAREGVLAQRRVSTHDVGEAAVLYEADNQGSERLWQAVSELVALLDNHTLEREPAQATARCAISRQCVNLSRRAYSKGTSPAVPLRLSGPETKGDHQQDHHALLCGLCSLGRAFPIASDEADDIASERCSGREGVQAARIELPLAMLEEEQRPDGPARLGRIAARAGERGDGSTPQWTVLKLDATCDEGSHCCILAIVACVRKETVRWHSGETGLRRGTPPTQTWSGAQS